MTNAHYKENMFEGREGGDVQGVAFRDETSEVLRIVPIGANFIEKVVLETADVIALVRISIRMMSDEEVDELERAIQIDRNSREE